MQSSATFKTDGAHRYLEAICRHFDRKAETHCDAGQGWVQFSFGRCDMTADAQRLEMIASAGDAKALDDVMDVVTRHLERYAFRENPRLEWRQGAAPQDIPETPENQGN